MAYSDVFGQLPVVTWGGTDLGKVEGEIVLPPLWTVEKVQPQSMGGEVYAYILKKTPIEITIPFSEFSDEVVEAAFGGFYTAGNVTIGDAVYSGSNLSANASFTKELVITPKGSASGLWKLTAPFATVIEQKIEKLFGTEHIQTIITFGCTRGTGSYVAKLEKIP